MLTESADSKSQLQKETEKLKSFASKLRRLYFESTSLNYQRSVASCDHCNACPLSNALTVPFTDESTLPVGDFNYIILLSMSVILSVVLVGPVRSSNSALFSRRARAHITLTASRRCAMRLGQKRSGGGGGTWRREKREGRDGRSTWRSHEKLSIL